MRQAVDSAGVWDSGSVQVLADAGIECALRYQYNLSGGEIERLHAANMGVGFIGEYDSLTWHPILAGYWPGRNHAVDSVAKMQARGFPAASAAWATSDTDVAPSQYSAAEPYVRGWSEVTRAAGYRAGLYGGEGLIDYLFDRGLIDVGWGSAATSWNHGHLSDRVVLRQLWGYRTFGRVQTDLNDVLGDCGHWAPHMEPKMEEDLTVADVQIILDKIDALALGELALALNTSRSHTAYKVEGEDAIFYLGGDSTPVRVHIPDPAMVSALQATGWLNAAIVTLSHADHQEMIDALGRLSQTEFVG